MKFVKVDVDLGSGAAATSGIDNVPSTVIFRDGEKIAEQIGITSLEHLMNFIEKNI